MQVVGYRRVSTEDQADSGSSLEAQSERIRAYCVSQGLTLLDVLGDPGKSAGSLDRPGLGAALAVLESGHAEGLVVAKLDRLTRSVGDFEVLLARHFGKSAGRRLHSAAEPVDTRTAAGRMVLRMMVVVSAWELEANHERTEGVLGHKQSRGERTGSVPYGFDLDESGPRNKKGRPIQLVRNLHEQAVLAQMRLLKGKGWSTRKIAALLNESSIPTKTGQGEWKHQTVEKILAKAQRETNDGERSEVVPPA